MYLCKAEKTWGWKAVAQGRPRRAPWCKCSRSRSLRRRPGSATAQPPPPVQRPADSPLRQVVSESGVWPGGPASLTVAGAAGARRPGRGGDGLGGAQPRGARAALRAESGPGAALSSRKRRPGSDTHLGGLVRWHCGNRSFAGPSRPPTPRRGEQSRRDSWPSALGLKAADAGGGEGTCGFHSAPSVRS